MGKSPAVGECMWVGPGWLIAWLPQSLVVMQMSFFYMWTPGGAHSCGLWWDYQRFCGKTRAGPKCGQVNNFLPPFLQCVPKLWIIVEEIHV